MSGSLWIECFDIERQLVSYAGLDSMLYQFCQGLAERGPFQWSVLTDCVRTSDIQTEISEYFGGINEVVFEVKDRGDLLIPLAAVSG